MTSWQLRKWLTRPALSLLKVVAVSSSSVQATTRFHIAELMYGGGKPEAGPWREER